MQGLAKLSLEDHTFELDRAMRIWATMDERAAITVARSERLVLAFLAQAFEDLGFSPGEASLRARILLSANIAPLLTSDGKSRRSAFKRTLEILIKLQQTPTPIEPCTRPCNAHHTSRRSIT